MGSNPYNDIIYTEIFLRIDPYMDDICHSLEELASLLKGILERCLLLIVVDIIARVSGKVYSTRRGLGANKRVRCRSPTGLVNIYE